MTDLRRDTWHFWHVAINRHADDQAKAKKHWPRFMYEAKSAAGQVSHMAALFKREREGALPATHQQCSHQAPVPVRDNHLTCCLGAKCRECDHLLALEGIAGAAPEEIDVAKAWTCTAHILMSGGDPQNEGYLLRTDDRMFWDNVYRSLEGNDG
jgi:hypothetical protein